MALTIFQEAVVDERDLHQILADSASLDVVVIGFGDSSEEVHRVGIAEIILESGEGISLSTQDFIDSEAVVSDVDEVAYMGRQNLLVLGCDEHGGNTNQLKLIQRDDLGRQEAVNDVDSKEERLREQPEPSVDLDEPVDEDTTHLPLEIVLVIHVVGIWHGDEFKLLVVVEDFANVFCTHGGIIKIFGIQSRNEVDTRSRWHSINVMLVLFCSFPRWALNLRGGIFGRGVGNLRSLAVGTKDTRATTGLLDLCWLGLDAVILGTDCSSRRICAGEFCYASRRRGLGLKSRFSSDGLLALDGFKSFGLVRGHVAEDFSAAIECAIGGGGSLLDLCCCFLDHVNIFCQG